VRVGLKTSGLLHSGVEQLVAHWAHNPEAEGSSPSPATMRVRPLNLHPYKSATTGGAQ
jgi:hypothetical protein